MNCFCEDCKVGSHSYENWVHHLTTVEHQKVSSAVQIEKWIQETSQNCVIMVSIFATKDPVEIATKFSKYGFLWNFYVHESQKFFVMQYDTKQTAEYTLTKSNNESSWKEPVRLLKDLDMEDWQALFPPPKIEDVKLTQYSNGVELVEPPSKIQKLDLIGSSSRSDTKVVHLQPIPMDPLKRAEHYTLLRKARGQADVSNASSNIITLVKSNPSNKVKSNFASVTSFEQDLAGASARFEQDTKLLPGIEKNLKEVSACSEKNASTNAASFTSEGELTTSDSVLENEIPNGSAATEGIGIPKLKCNPSKKLKMDFLMRLKKDSCLDEQLDEYFKITALSLNDLEQINEFVVGSLETMLKKYYPNCKLRLYDSFQGGIANSHYTLEINIDGLGDMKPSEMELADEASEIIQKREKYIYDLGILLEKEMQLLDEPKERPIHQIRSILNGLTSRVTFVHKISARHKFGLTCCLTRSDRTRDNNFKLIEFYLKLNSSIRSLLCLVHYWASFHQFLQPGAQLIRDYVLSLLVIVFLSRKSVVPTLDIIQTYCRKLKVDVSSNNWLELFCSNEELMTQVAAKIQLQFPFKHIFILDLAHEFFTTYAKDTLINQVVCIWTADLLPKSIFTSKYNIFPPALKQYKEYTERRGSVLSTDSPLVVQNPFDLGFNIASTTNLKTFKRFQLGCQKTAELLHDLLNNSPEKQDLMSIFVLFEKECSSASASHNHNSFSRRARQACEAMLKKVQIKYPNLPPQVNHTCNRYVCFDIHADFRNKFKSATGARSEFVSYANNRRLVKMHMSALWSTFSIDFIRTIWTKSFLITAKENVLIEELLDQDWVIDNVDVQEKFHIPAGYLAYYSIFDCQGLNPFQTEIRKKCLQNAQSESTDQAASSSAELKNPLDEEWLITQKSMKPRERNDSKRAELWNFQCTVLFDDAGSDHADPRFAVILSGRVEEQDIIDYLGHAISRMFHSYQMYLLQTWITNML